MTSSGSLRRWVSVGLLAAAFSAGLADLAEAQRFGRGPTPGAGACFYRDPDFQGEYLLRPGRRRDGVAYPVT